MTPEEVQRRAVTLLAERLISRTVADEVGEMLEPRARRLAASKRERSQWFRSLDDATRGLVEESFRWVAYSVLFDALCVFDGVVRLDLDDVIQEVRLIVRSGGEGVDLATDELPMMHDLLAEWMGI